MPPVKIAFIGTGNMGQCAHLRHYASLPGCEVIALAELRPQLGARVAADALQGVAFHLLAGFGQVTFGVRRP